MFRSVRSPMVEFGDSSATKVIEQDALLRATGGVGQVTPTERLAAAP